MGFGNYADLHIHLGATTSPHFLWELAHKQGIKIPEKDYWKFIDHVTIQKKMKSSTYLKKISRKKTEEASPFELTHKIQSSPFAVGECVHHAVSEAYRTAGINRIELRFNPMFRNRAGEHDLDKVILSATTALKRASLEYPIIGGIILETDRQFTEQQHITIARKAVAFKGFGVVGFDVSGPSLPSFKVESFVKAFEIVKNARLGTTFHTGEVTSADEMYKVIELLKPDRIGHGIKAYKDDALMDLIKKNNISLELCPTSNIKTGVVKDWAEMKKVIRTFIANGVVITINSDGPEFLNTNVDNELAMLQEKNIISSREAVQIVNASHTVSFIK